MFIPNHEETLVQRNRGEEEYGREDSLKMENKNSVIKLVSRGTLLSTMWKVVFGFTTQHILKTKQLIKNRHPEKNISKHNFKREEAVQK